MTVSQITLVRGRLADHPRWSTAFTAPAVAGRLIQPVVVSATVEERERVPEAPWLERVSLTELVRDARSASSAGLAGLLLLAAPDRRDERAMLASERDHVLTRAIHAVKDAAPDLAVATDVCVCAYTPHGQCVLFAEGAADVPGTIARLAEIALVHADAGADLLLLSGMVEGSVRALRAALGDAGRGETPVASFVKLESSLYASQRAATWAMPVAERVVPLVAPDDPDAARARALRDVSAGADAVVITPGLGTGDLVTRVAAAADRPVISFFTADEHALYAANDALADPRNAERESFVSARRAGADLVISFGARDAVAE